MKKQAKTILHMFDVKARAVLLFVCLLFSVSACAPKTVENRLSDIPSEYETTACDARDKILCSVLYLTCNTAGASANGIIMDITDSALLIVTSAHVADLIESEEGSAYAQAANGYPAFPVNILWTDEDADLAFLTAKKDGLDADLLNRISAAVCNETAYDNLQKGDILTCLYLDRLDPTGFFYPESSLGEAVLLNKSVPVDGFSKNMMYLDYPSLKGMSGSGIYDSCGNLVGLLSAGDEEQGTTVAVPLPDLLSAFEAASQLCNRLF